MRNVMYLNAPKHALNKHAPLHHQAQATLKYVQSRSDLDSKGILAHGVSLGGAVVAALAASPEGIGNERQDGCSVYPSDTESSSCTFGLAGIILENTFESIPRHVAMPYEGFLPISMQRMVLSFITRLSKDECVIRVHMSSCASSCSTN